MVWIKSSCFVGMGKGGALCNGFVTWLFKKTGGLDDLQ